MPTRQILLDLANDSFEGLIGGNGRLLARPTAARVAGQTVILPVTLSAKIVDGAFVTPVALEVTDAAPKWAWTLELKDARDTTLATRTVLVPAGVDPIAVGDLPLVDVCTLQPDAEPDAAWWAAVQPLLDSAPEVDALLAAYAAGDLGGVKVYASQAELDAVTDSEIGQFLVADMAAFFGIPALADKNSLVTFETAVTKWVVGAASTYGVVQRAFFMDPANQTFYEWVRTRYANNGVWGTWGEWFQLPTLPEATQFVFGGTRYATASQAAAMSSTVRAVTPSNLADASSSSDVTGSKLVRRDGAGRFRSADPVNLSDVSNKGYVDARGFYAYATEAEFLAETTTRSGILTAATNWGAFSGISALNNYSGTARVETIVSLRVGSPQYTQIVYISDAQTGSHTKRIRRTKSSTAAWSTWGWDFKVATPVETSDAATKLYVDSRGLTLLSSWADLNTISDSHAVTGRVLNPGFNLGTATGIAKYNGWGMGEVWFEQYAGYGPGDRLTNVQRAWIPNLDGTVDEIRRTRVQNASWIWGPWSPWAIYSTAAEQPVIPGLYDDREQTASTHSLRTGLNTASGNLFISIHRARITAQRSRVVAISAGSATSGLTTCSIGVYSVDPSDWSIDALLARVDDTTLFDVAYAREERVLSAPVSFVKGNYYAVMHLNVGANTGARAAVLLPSFNMMASFDPPMMGFKSGQAALPTTPLAYADYTTEMTSGQIYYEFLT